MTPITCATLSPPKEHSPSSLTTRHARSNIPSTSTSMPNAISWNAASANSSSSAASRPVSRRPPETTGPLSLSQPSSYGCDNCPHHLALAFAVPAGAVGLAAMAIRAGVEHTEVTRFRAGLGRLDAHRRQSETEQLAHRGGPARHPLLEAEIVQRRQFLRREHDLQALAACQITGHEMPLPTWVQDHNAPENEQVTHSHKFEPLRHLTHQSAKPQYA